MRIIIALFATVLLLAVTGCSGPRASMASAGGTADHFAVSSGHGSDNLQYPEGDYRNILSDPGPF